MGTVLLWIGLYGYMLKYLILAIDFATRQMDATDSIKLNGVAFPVLRLDQAASGHTYDADGQFFTKESICDGRDAAAIGGTPVR